MTKIKVNRQKMLNERLLKIIIVNDSDKIFPKISKARVIQYV